MIEGIHAGEWPFWHCAGLQRTRFGFTPNQLSSKHSSERFSFRVTLPSIVAPFTAILRLVGRQLAVAIRADEPQVQAAVVGRVPVHVIEDQYEGHAIPVVSQS